MSVKILVAEDDGDRINGWYVAQDTAYHLALHGDGIIADWHGKPFNSGNGYMVDIDAFDAAAFGGFKPKMTIADVYGEHITTIATDDPLSPQNSADKTKQKVDKALAL